MTEDSRIWLEILPGTRRLVRVLSYGAIGIGIASCLALATWIATRMGADRLATRGHLLVAGAPVVIMALAVCSAAYLRGVSQVRLSLGTDGTRLFVRRKDVIVDSAQIDSTVTNGDYLLVGRRMVPLRYGFAQAFDRELLARQILGRLPESSLVSTYAILWRALRAGNQGAWALLILVFAAVGWSLLR